MQKRRVLINLLLAFAILPALKLGKDLMKISLQHDNTYFSGSFEQYVKINALMTFSWVPIIFILIVLLPYNFLLITLWEKVNNSILKKIGLFMFVLIAIFCLFGTFANVWSTQLRVYFYYFLSFLMLCILFVLPIHFWVDKKELVNSQDNKTVE